MAEHLAFENDRLWDTALATALRVWRMKLAVIIDGVPLILRECTILAFLVASVRLSTLLALGCYKTIEGLVLTIADQALVFVIAIWAFHVGAVITPFDFSLFSDFCLLYFVLLRLSFSTRGCCSRIICTLSRCVNQIADSVDSGTR